MLKMQLVKRILAPLSVCLAIGFSFYGTATAGPQLVGVIGNDCLVYQYKMWEYNRRVYAGSKVDCRPAEARGRQISNVRTIHEISKWASGPNSMVTVARNTTNTSRAVGYTFVSSGCWAPLTWRDHSSASSVYVNGAGWSGSGNFSYYRLNGRFRC